MICQSIASYVVDIMVKILNTKVKIMHAQLKDLVCLFDEVDGIVIKLTP